MSPIARWNVVRWTVARWIVAGAVLAAGAPAMAVASARGGGLPEEMRDAGLRAPGPRARSPFPDPRERLRLLSEAAGPPPAQRPARPEDPQLARLRAAQDDYDLRHVRLEIDLTTHELQQFRGAAIEIVTSRVESLSEVVFDLWGGVLVDSVLVNGVPAMYEHESEFLLVALDPPLPSGESVSIRVTYLGGPGPAPGLGMAFQFHRNRAFIWTLSEPSGGRTWWPCKDRPDDKADSCDVIITTPEWMTAASNGLLRSVTSGPDLEKTWWWHHSYPIAPYLVSIAAGEFARLTGEYPIPGGGSMPLEHFVFPEQVEAATEDCSITPEAIDALAARFGPYPFLREKYGISVFGWGGGMEHQTNTSYGWWLLDGDHSQDWIFVHELAHQWWGDAVTCATWADLWLNEGFASWCEAVWFESRGGGEAYRQYMVSVQLVEDPAGPVYDYPDLFSGNVHYNKGAWIVHMLRGVLGDSLFFRGLADFRALFEGRSATTAQLQETLEGTSGRDLDWFFDEWVYHGTVRPHYRVSKLSEPTDAGQRLYLHLDQTQGSERFAMPVRLRVRSGTTVRDTLFWNDQEHEDLWIDLPRWSASVEVDPENWILCTAVEGVYGLNLLTARLDSARVDSAVALPLLARGGGLPYLWQALDTLPLGISLRAESGRLEGTPARAGDYEFRVRVTDASVPPLSDTQRISWTIVPATPDTTAPPPVLVRMVAVPNPSLRSVLLSFQAPAGSGPVEWRVFDPAGRLVARGESRETQGKTGGGSDGDQSVRSWLWDGRDLGGQRAPAGVYLVQGRVSGTGRMIEGRLVRLR